MKRFTTDGTNEQEGRELIPAPRRTEQTPLDLSFEGGGVAGARRFSRRRALGLLGGSLAGVSLLSLGLTAPAKAVGPYGIRGRSGYTIPQLRAVRGGNWYNLTLSWKCVFELSVVNRTFATNWVLKEDDSTSYDDFVDATVPPHQHSAGSPTKIFIPSQANPSNPQEVSFQETIGWHRDDLDTEIGDEELFAIANLLEYNTRNPVVEKLSNQLPLAP